ncbi:MAG: carboxypeptidase regulatory-like domain-containing protein, partial [Acidimicrobiia bacterium]|nr:carboxypeptidase regulatory-like domain-containing protein [Acidimicrobiia bacterium]
GIQDGSETGLDGVVVELLDGAGTVMASTSTAGGGFYSFDNLAPGDYEVRFVAPVGYLITVANLGGDDTVDSDADPITGETGVLTYPSNGSTSDVDAGLYQPNTIGNLVWEDLNGNGLQDDGTTGLAGVTVTATYYGPDGILGTGDDEALVTTTDVDGLYSFAGVAPGMYDVAVTDPAGSVATTATTFTAISVASGDTYLSADSGFYFPAGVGDFVWVDLDGDGTQDVEEPGLAGVTVTLVGTDGLGNAVSLSDVTDINGVFGFASLAPGSYTVSVDGSGWTFTLQDVGDDTADSDVNAAGTTTVTVVSGTDDLSVDAGVLPATIGDYVWVDANGNGLQDSGELPLAGVTVNLRDSATDVVVATATSAGDGSYSLAAAPGSYVVEFVAPGGYAYTESNVGADDGSDSDATQISGRTGTISIADSSDSTVMVDAGFYEQATISDFVWIDADGDGLQGGTEAGLDGVTVTLTGLDGAGNVISLSDTTAGGGLYGFAVPPGTYTVTFDLSTATGSYVLTTPDAGDDSLDSDAGAAGDSSGSAPALTVTSGEIHSSVDAGAYEGVTIAGSVFEDAFAEGTQDPADVALQGVGVSLLDGLGNTVTSTTTDIKGDYTFTVPPGDYQIVVDVTGYFVSPQDAAADGIDSDIDVTGATAIFSAASGLSFDFDGLLFARATISDLVFVDLDADGIHDVAEPGLAGVTVSLFADVDQDGNPDGPALTSTVTDADGLYGFIIDPGSYVVVVDGSGFTFTTANVGGNDALDSDVDSAGTTGTVTVVSSQVDDSVDAGVLPALLSDFVWDDLNADGIQDGGEPGIENVTVNLWADTSGNGTPDTVIATDLTDVNGIYELA